MSANSKSLGKSRIFLIITTFILAIGLIGINPPQSSAQTDDEIKITTSFPHIVLNAGETLTRRITINNVTGSGKTVNLNVKYPEGWSAFLRDSEIEVKSVYLPTNVSEYTTLEIYAPPKEGPGTYPVTVEALNKDNEVIGSLEITADIETTTAGEIELSSRYPTMEGPPGQNLQFTIDVKNRGGKRTINYKLLAPGGWDTKITPEFESTTIQSQVFNSGEEKTVKATVTPPKTVSPNEYPVRFVASTKDETENLDLLVNIPGTYRISLNTKSGRLNTEANAGEKKTVNIVVRNTGTASLKDINLGTGLNLPEGWSSQFKPSKIDELQPGEARPGELTLTPASDAIPGDYSFTIEATANKPYTRKDSFDLRVTVNPGTTWGFIGIGIIVVIIIGLFITFWRFGRR